MFSAVLTTLDLGSAVGGWWSSLGTGDQATWVSSLVTGLVLLVTAWAATAAARAAGAASRLVEIETERRQDEKNAAAEALKASRRAQAERISARYVRGEVTGGSEVVLVNHSARPVFKVQVLLHGDSECSRLKDLVRRAAGTITPVIQPGCHVIDVLPPTMSSPVVEPVLSAWRPTPSSVRRSVCSGRLSAGEVPEGSCWLRDAGARKRRHFAVRRRRQSSLDKGWRVPRRVTRTTSGTPNSGLTGLTTIGQASGSAARIGDSWG